MTEHHSNTDARPELTGAHARFERACASRPWRTIGIWFLATLVLIGLTAAFHGKLVNEFKLPGSDTQRATDLLKAKFPAQNGSALTFVFQAPAGQRIDTPAHKAAIDEIIAMAKKAQYATRTTSPFEKGNLSKSGRVGFFDQSFSKNSFDLSWTNTKALMDSTQAVATKAGLNLQFTGDASSGAPSSGSSEIFGLIAGLIVLLFLFRALVPTVIPLIFAIIAVASAFMLLYLGAQLTSVNTITPIIASMIGLGVGIDYSLFIVTRFRQLLHDGLSPRDAAARAAATSGRAVIFAGITVAISITGLFVIGLSFITIMGVGGALGVLTSVILANTLLPAVLAKLGHKIDRGGMKLPQADESFEGQHRTPVARWGRFVTSHPRPVFIIALVVALLLAAPALKVRLGAADAGTAPEVADDPPGVRHPVRQDGRLRPGLHLADHRRRQGRGGRREQGLQRAPGPHGTEGQRRLRLEAVREQGRRRRHHQRVLAVLSAGRQD